MKRDQIKIATEIIMVDGNEEVYKSEMMSLVEWSSKVLALGKMLKIEVNEAKEQDDDDALIHVSAV